MGPGSGGGYKCIRGTRPLSSVLDRHNSSPITMWNITFIPCLVFVYSQPSQLLWICVRPIGEKCRPICKVQPTNGNREPEVVGGRHNRQYLLQMIFLSKDSDFLCHSVIVIVGWFLIFGLGHIVPHPAVIILASKRMWECVADQSRRTLSNRQSGGAGLVADYCGRFSWGTSAQRCVFRNSISVDWDDINCNKVLIKENFTFADNGRQQSWSLPQELLKAPRSRALH